MVPKSFITNTYLVHYRLWKKQICQHNLDQISYAYPLPSIRVRVYINMYTYNKRVHACLIAKYIIVYKMCLVRR